MSIIKRLSAIQGCPFRGIPLYSVSKSDFNCSRYILYFGKENRWLYALRHNSVVYLKSIYESMD